MFDDLRVLDLSEEPGWLTGKILGDLGADVVKVEPPGGDRVGRRGPFLAGQQDPERSLPWLALNTSKRGITLDCEKEGGQRLLRQLAAKLRYRQARILGSKQIPLLRAGHTLQLLFREGIQARALDLGPQIQVREGQLGVLGNKGGDEGLHPLEGKVFAVVFQADGPAGLIQAVEKDADDPAELVVRHLRNFGEDFLLPGKNESAHLFDPGPPIHPASPGSPGPSAASQ